MLWITVPVGRSVQVGSSLLTLIAKDKDGITIEVDGQQYPVERNSLRKFPQFTVHPRSCRGKLRLGFEAPQEVSIRRISA